jgi:hypothetical protein
MKLAEWDVSPDNGPALRLLTDPTKGISVGDGIGQGTAGSDPRLLALAQAPAAAREIGAPGGGRSNPRL